MGVGGPHDQRIRPPQFLVEKSDGVGLAIVGAEGVGADELRQPVGLVGLGAARRPHLVENDRKPAPGDLPGRFAAGEAAPDDVDG